MAQSDLRSRIVIEGADKAVADLKTLGTTGDKAFGDVGKAADQSSHSVTAFTRATNLAAQAMSSMRSAASGMQHVGNRLSEFGTALGNVAGNIIPRWRELLALGTVGGFAGFFKLFEATAQWGHELEENSKRLGLTAGELGLIGKAAKQAGVDMDHLTEGMLKFAVHMENAGDERRKLFGDLAKEVLGANSAVGGATVFRGGQVGGAAADGTRFIQVRPMAEFREQAEEAYGYLKSIGALGNRTLPQWLSEVSQKLAKGGEEAAKLTEILNKAGANVPVTKLGEQIDQAMPGFKDLFAQFKVPLFDKATGGLRKFTDVFGDFLEGFKDKTPGEQARLVTQNLGRGFTDLIPLMQKGRKGLFEFFDEARARGIDTSAFDKEIAALDESFRALRRLDSAIASVRKSFALPFGDVFTPLINQLVQTIDQNKAPIQQFFANIASQLKVVAADLVNVFKGAAPQTDFGKGVVDGLNAINVAIGVVRTAWGLLVAALQPVADTLNAVFGKDYSAQTYALAAALLYFSGILPALIIGVQAFAAALALITTNPIGLALTALGLIALTIYQNWSTLGPLFKQLYDDLVGFGNWISTSFVAIWDAGLSAVQNLWAGFTNWVGGQVQQIKGWIDWIFSALSRAQTAAGQQLSAPGGVLPAPGLASGGHVRGPGTGTSDSILARLSNGEFVMNARAVRRWGPGFFAALNGYRGGGQVGPVPGFASGGSVSKSLEKASYWTAEIGTWSSNFVSDFSSQMSSISNETTSLLGQIVSAAGSANKIVNDAITELDRVGMAAGGLVGGGSYLPQSTIPMRAFADGGMVGSGGGTPVHLHLGGHSFALTAGADVVQSLAHEARRYQLRSAGTKPSWYGGTPGGR